MRLIHCMPQSATLAPFRPLILAISHFDVLNCNSDTFENLSKTFKTFLYNRFLVFQEKRSITAICCIQKFIFENFSFSLAFCWLFIWSLQILLLKLKWKDKQIVPFVNLVGFLYQLYKVRDFLIGFLSILKNSSQIQISLTHEIWEYGYPNQRLFLCLLLKGKLWFLGYLSLPIY